MPSTKPQLHMRLYQLHLEEIFVHEEMEIIQLLSSQYQAIYCAPPYSPRLDDLEVFASESDVGIPVMALPIFTPPGSEVVPSLTLQSSRYSNCLRSFFKYPACLLDTNEEVYRFRM